MKYAVFIVEKEDGVLCNSRDFRDRILAMKGGEKE